MNHSETQDEKYLRMAFAVAAAARAMGQHPFGCIMVGPDGEILLEQGNAYETGLGRGLSCQMHDVYLR